MDYERFLSSLRFLAASCFQHPGQVFAALSLAVSVTLPAQPPAS